MILKEYSLPNGALTNAHLIRDIQINGKLTHATVQVSSYSTEDAYLSGAGLMWSTPIGITLEGIDGPIVAAIESWLVLSPDSPFEGGVITVDQSDSLEAAKTRAWNAIKVARSIAEVGNFTYDGGSYQADKERVMGAVQLAVLAKTNNWPYSETWTLTDNTTRTLDADGVIGLGLALGQFVSGVFAIGRELRDQINAAETLEQVQSIRWPTEVPSSPTPTPEV